MTIAYALQLYNVAPRVAGLTVAVPYVAGSGVLVISSIATLPPVPFRLTVVTLSSRGSGLNEVLTCFPVLNVASMTNVLTLGGPIEGTQDRNYAIGDLCEIRDNSSAITDLNAAVLSATPIIVTGLTATGTDEATALPLVGNNSIQEVTVTGAGTGVTLPVPTLPASVTVINTGLNPLAVYPAAGGTIYNVSSPVTIDVGASLRFFASSTSNWYY